MSSQTAALSALQVPQDRRGMLVRKASLVLLDQPAPQDRQVKMATKEIGVSPGQLDLLEQQGLQERVVSRELQAHRGSEGSQDHKGSADLPGLQGHRVHRAPLDREANRDLLDRRDHGVNQAPRALLDLPDPLDRLVQPEAPIRSRASQNLRAWRNW